MCRCPTNNKFIFSSHAMKFPQSLSSKRSKLSRGFESEMSLFSLWVWNLLKVVVSIFCTTKEVKKVVQRRLKWGCSRQKSGGSYSSSSRTRFCIQLFHCWGVLQQLQFYNSMGLCAQFSHFRRVRGNHLWIQRRFAPWRVWLWITSWWDSGRTLGWTVFQKENEIAQ